MTNVHHLHVVGQGAGRWNAWRQQEPNVQPDLAGADLKGADLAGMDLTGAVLSLANLRKADLSGANLKLANLAGANMDEINLSGAYLEGATIAGAYLLRANLSGACLRRVNLAGASLVGKINLSGADLTGANLAGARLVGAKLTGANLSRAILAGADLREADLGGANLTDADTSGAKFDGANMSGSIIRDYRVGGRRRLGPDDEEDETGELDFEAARPSREGAAPVPPAQREASEAQAPVEETPLPPAEAREVLQSQETSAPGVEAARPSPAGKILGDVPAAIPVETAPAPPTPQDVAPEAETFEDETDSLMAVVAVQPVSEPEPAAIDEVGYPGAVEDVTAQSIQVGETSRSGAESSLMSTVVEPTTRIEPMGDQKSEVQTAIEPPAPMPDEADDSFYSYERKDLAILMLFSSQFSRKTKEERRLLLDLLIQYNKIFFGVKSQISMATRDSSIIAGFENPTDALRCAGLYINILRDMKVDAYVCVNWGFATVRTNMGDSVHSDLILNSISPAARLRPVGNAGEILILDELYTNAATDKSLFQFEPVTRKWTLMSTQSGPSVDVLCYRVANREISGNA